MIYKQKHADDGMVAAENDCLPTTKRKQNSEQLVINNMTEMRLYSV